MWFDKILMELSFQLIAAEPGPVDLRRYSWLKGGLRLFKFCGKHGMDKNG